jgi:hypothetical protein
MLGLQVWLWVGLQVPPHPAINMSLSLSSTKLKFLCFPITCVTSHFSSESSHVLWFVSAESPFCWTISFYSTIPYKCLSLHPSILSWEPLMNDQVLTSCFYLNVLWISHIKPFSTRIMMYSMNLSFFFLNKSSYPHFLKYKSWDLFSISSLPYCTQIEHQVLRISHLKYSLNPPSPS